MGGCANHPFFLAMAYNFLYICKKYKFMFSKIYQILEEILGKSKQGEYDRNVDQYQFNCPCCAENNGGIPDNKYNLEVNLKIGKYNCWKCSDTDGTKGNIRFLIKKWGSPMQYKRYKEEIQFLVRSKLYDINLYSNVYSKEEDNIVTLPKTFTKIVINECTNKKLLSYLSERKIDQTIVNKFNLGYTTWDEDEKDLRNRIIIPSYDEYGDLNYWVGRDFTGFHKKMKYKNCDYNKKDIVFQESKINWDFDIILCEGAIDCLYPVNGISLLGKTLHKDSELFKVLHNKANGNIIIVLDADTDIFETKSIYKLLDFGRLKDKVWYVRLNKMKDFGELYEKYGKKGIINAIRHKQQFNELELLF